jgi:type IV pilus biogenesis protein CpaD/CtpE
MTMAWRRLRAAGASLLTGIVLSAMAGCAEAPPLPAPTAEQPCPQWVTWPTDEHSNADPAYPGCNVAANLRAMIAESTDLWRGRPSGPADGERESRAVESYQQGKVKAFEGTGALTPAIAMPGSASGGTP